MKTMKLFTMMTGLMFVVSSQANNGIAEKTLVTGAAIGACSAKISGDKQVTASVKRTTAYFMDLTQEINHTDLNSIRGQQQIKQKMTKSLSYAKRLVRKGSQNMNETTREVIANLLTTADSKLQSGNIQDAASLVKDITAKLTSCN